MSGFGNSKIIEYNPGIEGFIKAARHPSGSVLIMVKHRVSSYDFIKVFWAKYLHYRARPIEPYIFGNSANRAFEHLLSVGPPPNAIRDYQRELLYKWEEDIIYPSYRALSWPRCERFAATIWQKVGNGNSLKLTYSRRFQGAYALSGMIHLPPHDKAFFWRKPVILHEIVHEIFPYAQHGPDFLRNYIDLCVQFLGLDREYLETTAVEYRLRYKTKGHHHERPLYWNFPKEADRTCHDVVKC